MRAPSRATAEISRCAGSVLAAWLRRFYAYFTSKRFGPAKGI